MRVEWNDAYAVGHDKIDGDHKRLFALMDKLCEAMNQQQGHDAVRMVLVELVDYTKTHFAREESFMQATNYPAYEQHRAKHVDMIEKVGELMRREADGDISVTIATLNFMRDWLTGHIQGTDRALAAHLATHPVN